jgi:hypothetical protein
LAKRKQVGPKSAAQPKVGATRKKVVKSTRAKPAATKAPNAKSLPRSCPGSPATRKVVPRHYTGSQDGNRPVIRSEIARRLREIRQEIFGDKGGPELARRLDLPVRTWYGYETGVTVPAEVLLGFIEQTGTNPMFVLAGERPNYQSRAKPE